MKPFPYSKGQKSPQPSPSISTGVRLPRRGSGGGAALFLSNRSWPVG